jgi:dolichyl-phosphate beta-glucosyltransferase
LQFSLIIPSYNNADELMLELPALLVFLHAKGHEVETIVVDDGTADVIELTLFCERNGHTLLRHEFNKGKGAAVRTGMLHAKQSIRIFTDADIPFQYETMDSMLSAFQDASVDAVAGDRRQSDYFRNTPALRQMGSRVFSMAVDVLMGKRMGDTQCGIKGFRDTSVKRVFEESRLDGFAADIEWLHRAQKQGLNIQLVPAEFRNAGKSSVVFWKHAILMLRDVLKIRFS